MYLKTPSTTKISTLLRILGDEAVDQEMDL